MLLFIFIIVAIVSLLILLALAIYAFASSFRPHNEFDDEEENLQDLHNNQ